MTFIICIFALSLILSLFLTPLAGRLGKRVGAIDFPGSRKIHEHPVPRFGGLAICSSFIITLIISNFFGVQLVKQLILDQELIYLAAGGLIVFATGIMDDVHRLGPKTKFSLQILGCTIPYIAGLSIQELPFLFTEGLLPYISYPLTIFWFLLFINAINLIDGLDGMAGGIVFFATIVMIILSLLQSMILMAFIFAALSGAILGFLRYNFNPATIFLGDGGSYFLGYSLAGLSIYGSVKSQLSSIILITILALGIPLMDTLIAPLRRFMRGRRMFYPDKGHIHHRLLAKGLSARTAVMILYSATACLCILSITLVHIQHEFSSLILIFLGIIGFIFFRKAGYMEYLAADRIRGWLNDMYDSLGLSFERRTFLDVQINMERAECLSECWDVASYALDIIGVDYAELYLPPHSLLFDEMSFKCKTGQAGKNGIICWSRNGFDRDSALYQRTVFKMEMPLITKKGRDLGSLWLIIDFEGHDPKPFIMRRIEQLRVTLIKNMRRLEEKKS